MNQIEFESGSELAQSTRQRQRENVVTAGDYGKAGHSPAADATEVKRREDQGIIGPQLTRVSGLYQSLKPQS